MQWVMDRLVDNCQAAFVPGRMITDNILMSHELVKGYGRKSISFICILKIDMQKAYDSVEWMYIEQVLRLPNFPKIFVRWIMACIRTMTYSVLINGRPTDLLRQKKWAQARGDMQPVQILHQHFQKFSAASGLAHIFILPKKVIQFIETICRGFLWTGDAEPTKKALIAWERLCSPKVAGGLNFIDVALRNEAAICNLLWNICTRKEKLWVHWVHTYYVKGQAVWSVEPKNAS
ncbi:uncharacterized protein LOC142172494 [Nicotiana tabacum]|uniref:Uncharacterized protein LOC142172494 n=1 Tax=Nicotiana tabacum TaxID=4097 RepID=A0AC58T4R4_TOBAC